MNDGGDEMNFTEKEWQDLLQEQIKEIATQQETFPTHVINQLQSIT